MTKDELRRSMLGALAALDPVAVGEKSRRIAARLIGSPEWKESEHVLVFLSLPHEVDTEPIIRAAREQGKTVAVPDIAGGEIVFRLLGEGWESLPTGILGLRVPDPAWPVIDPGEEDRILVVAPGLAFDRKMNRLGRGKGFYDRFLGRARRGWPGRISVIAVCFSLQIVEEVPAGSGDLRVDSIVTEVETMG